MKLDGKQTFEGTTVGVVVNQLGGKPAVDFVNEVISAGDHRELGPLGKIGGDGFVFVKYPAVALGIDKYIPSVKAKDAAALFLVGHAGVLDRGMNVALIAGDRVIAELRLFAGAVLDAGVVVADDAHRGSELEISYRAVTPYQESVVLEVKRSRAGSHDDSVFNFPKPPFPFPACEVLAIEEGSKTLGFGGWIAAKFVDEVFGGGVVIDVRRARVDEFALEAGGETVFLQFDAEVSGVCRIFLLFADGRRSLIEEGDGRIVFADQCVGRVFRDPGEDACSLFEKIGESVDAEGVASVLAVRSPIDHLLRV